MEQLQGGSSEPRADLAQGALGRSLAFREPCFHGTDGLSVPLLSELHSFLWRGRLGRLSTERDLL